MTLAQNGPNDVWNSVGKSFRLLFVTFTQVTLTLTALSERFHWERRNIKESSKKRMETNLHHEQGFNTIGWPPAQRDGVVFPRAHSTHSLTHSALSTSQAVPKVIHVDHLI